MSDLAQRRKQLAEAVMRDSICEAAAAVLAEVGFAGLTMDRVAQMADVSKGTLYNYFRDRDALVIEVVERAFLPLDAALDLLLEDCADPCQTLIGMVRAILQYVDEQRGLGKVLCGAEAPPFLEAEFRAKHMRLIERLGIVFMRARAVGVLRPDCTNPSLAARFFAMALHGVIDERILYGEECPPLAEELDFLTTFVIRPWFKETTA